MIGFKSGTRSSIKNSDTTLKRVFRSFKLKKSSLLFMAAASVPLDAGNWEMLKFSSLKPSTFVATPNKLTIKVRQSSSPLIQKLKKPITFTRVVAKGAITNGSINLKEGQKQGIFKKKSITDDYALRLGLVLEGKNKKPKYLPKFMLPSWIKRLFSLAPKDKGVDKIYFLKVVNNASDVGEKRAHPLNKLIFEEGAVQAKTGAFTIDKTFESPKTVYGIWLSANGEGTQSQFDTSLDSIEFY